MIPRAFAIAGITATLAAAADPTWQKDLSSPDPGPFPPISPSVLEYRISWKGMLDAGHLQMDFAPVDAKKPGRYVIRSSAASRGAAVALFPFQSHYWSELDPPSLRPRFFHAVETDRKETVTTTTRHLEDRVTCTESTKQLKTSVTNTSTPVFKFQPTFDIFSAMLHVRSQKLDNGDRITLVVHPFDNPYLLHIKVVHRELHLDRKTIRLSVGMRKIDRNTRELRPYKKLKGDATLWLSDDSDRIPVEFRAEVFIGDVRATLSRHTKPP